MGPRVRSQQMTLQDAFQQAQKNIIHHEACIEASLNMYHELACSSEELVKQNDFHKDFFDLFNRCLLVFKREPAVERVIEFVVKFVATTAHDTDGNGNHLIANVEEDPFHFMNVFINHLIEISGAKDKAVRFRACQTLSKLLHALDEDAEIDDDVWDKLQDAMLIRITDKIPVVRVQAINALSRLQDPTDADCPVIREYRQRLVSDSSPDVRKTALIQIALTKATINDVISRARDVKEVVRKALYTVLMDKLDVRALTIQQRLDLLQNGLNDRCPDVRQACAKLIAHGWYEQLGKNAATLFNLLDAETDEDTCLLVAKALLQEVSTMTEQSWKKFHFSAAKSPSEYFWWRCLCQHFHQMSDHDALEEILPVASHLAEQVGSVAKQLIQMIQRATSDDSSVENDYDSNQEDIDVQQHSQVFSFCQLLKVATLADYSDEAGRRAMSARIRSFITNYWQYLPKLVLQNAFYLIITLHSTRPEWLDVINEIIQNMKTHGENPEHDANESCIQTKLYILQLALKRCDVAPQTTCLTPLIDSLILPSIQSPNADTRNDAIECLGLCCVANQTFAQAHLLLLLQVLQVDQDALQQTALRIIFDLALAFGVAELVPAITVEQSEERSSFSQNRIDTTIISLLRRYLDSDNDHLRATAVEGFAKLLMHNHISSAQIFSHLVILYFNPMTAEDVSTRQCLSIFFPMFAFSSRDHQDIIEEAFLPTVRTIAVAPQTSPLRSVKLQDVTDLLVYLTSRVDTQELGMPPVPSLGVHENIAVAVANEILSDPLNLGTKSLCKTLSSLQVASMDKPTREALFVLGESILEKIQDRYSRSYIEKMIAEAQVDGSVIAKDTRIVLAEQQTAHEAVRKEELQFIQSEQNKEMNMKKEPRRKQRRKKTKPTNNHYQKRLPRDVSPSDSAADSSADENIDDLLSNNSSESDASEDNNDQEYEIEDIVGVRVRGNQRMFRVRWKGHPPSEDTWEPEEHLPVEVVKELIEDNTAQTSGSKKRRGKAKGSSKKNSFGDNEIDMLLASDSED